MNRKRKNKPHPNGTTLKQLKKVKQTISANSPQFKKYTHTHKQQICNTTLQSELNILKEAFGKTKATGSHKYKNKNRKRYTYI